MSTAPRRLGRYELQARLGQGGGGDVWKALDTQLRRHVAIKLLHADLQNDPSFVTRFEHEAQFIAALRHPNIIQIHDFDFEQREGDNVTIAYMVMEYIEGQTLETYILNTSRKQLFPSAEDLVYLFTAISLALDYAHQKGTIHRDIKPANILLDRRVTSVRTLGRPILTDFGVAKMQSMQTETIVGTVLGTPRYMAPEQAQGTNVTHSSDLYSLGIILYEMNTGVTPFRGEGVLALLRQHLYDTPTPPALINPNIPPALSAVILKSIEKEPKARFPSASAMTIAMAEALNVPIPESLRPKSALSSTNNTGATTNAPPYQISLSPPWTSYPQRPTSPIADAPIPNGQNSNPTYTPAQPQYLSPASSMTPRQNSWAGQNQVIAPPALQPIAPSTIPPIMAIIKSKRYMLLIVLLIGILIASGVGAFVLFQQNKTSTTPGTVPSGQISFSSSSSPSTGNYDTLHIDLHTIPPPPQGYTYYAWIEGLFISEHLVPHWALTPIDKSIHTDALTYQSVQNLYKPNTLFLVTLEAKDSPPTIPTMDTAKRIYYAKITSNTSMTFTVLKCPTDPQDTTCITG